MSKSRTGNKCIICGKQGATGQTHCLKCNQHHSSKSLCPTVAATKGSILDYFGGAKSAAQNIKADIKNAYAFKGAPSLTISMKSRRKQTECKHCGVIGKSSATHCFKCFAHHSKNHQCIRTNDQLHPASTKSETAQSKSSIKLLHSPSSKRTSELKFDSTKTKLSTKKSRVCKDIKNPDFASPNLDYCSFISEDSQSSFLSASSNLNPTFQLIKRFSYQDHAKMLLPFPGETIDNQTKSEDYFSLAGDVNNMHFISPLGDGDCFFHGLIALATLNKWRKVPKCPDKIRNLLADEFQNQRLGFYAFAAP